MLSDSIFDWSQRLLEELASAQLEGKTSDDFAKEVLESVAPTIAVGMDFDIGGDGMIDDRDQHTEEQTEGFIQFAFESVAERYVHVLHEFKTRGMRSGYSSRWTEIQPRMANLLNDLLEQIAWYEATEMYDRDQIVVAKNSLIKFVENYVIYTENTFVQLCELASLYINGLYEVHLMNQRALAMELA